MCCGNSINLLI